MRAGGTQERLTTSLSASVEEIAEQLQDISTTMATEEDVTVLKDAIKQVKNEVKQFSASVDDQFHARLRRAGGYSSQHRRDTEHLNDVG